MGKETIPARDLARRENKVIFDGVWRRDAEEQCTIQQRFWVQGSLTKNRPCVTLHQRSVTYAECQRSHRRDRIKAGARWPSLKKKAMDKVLQLTSDLLYECNPAWHRGRIEVF